MANNNISEMMARAGQDIADKLAERDALATKLAEAYQVIGALAHQLGGAWQGHRRPEADPILADTNFQERRKSFEAYVRQYRTAAHWFATDPGGNYRAPSMQQWWGIWQAATTAAQELTCCAGSRDICCRDGCVALRRHKKVTSAHDPAALHNPISESDSRG